MNPVLANILWIAGAVVVLAAAGLVWSRIRRALQRRGTRQATAETDRDEVTGRLQAQHDAVRLDAEQDTARAAARAAGSYRATP